MVQTGKKIKQNGISLLPLPFHIIIIHPEKYGDARNSSFYKGIVFMPVIVKCDVAAIIRINPVRGNDDRHTWPRQKKGHHNQASWRCLEPDKMRDNNSNDTFAFIAGYTDGGAPYGTTWEELGIEPYASPEEIEKAYDNLDYGHIENQFEESFEEETEGQ